MALFRGAAALFRLLAILTIPLWICRPASDPVDEGEDRFRKLIWPVFASRCVECHGEEEQKGGLRLDMPGSAGESGSPWIPGNPAESLILRRVGSGDPELRMPPRGSPLSEERIGSIRRWIAQGAVWPEGFSAETHARDFWSLRPLRSPPVPRLSGPLAARARNPVDAFVFARLRKEGLEPSAPADRRVLMRRLSYDLLGVPPEPERIERFVDDPDPAAYERLVDEWLASPRYGERWARHWLDAVHFGETHGYDKDKPRPNAWPYRDYVIRAFNQDRPYERFIREQLAGDALWPGTLDGLAATGFIAAGPWDFIGHAEVAEDRIDGKVARNLDRNDMVAATMNTFASLTVQCARCHDHKFDPVGTEEYYGLQAVFAALDRSDAEFDPDPGVRAARSDLEARMARMEEERVMLEASVEERGGERLARAREEVRALEKGGGRHPAFGYHSAIAEDPDVPKWVEIDLGREVEAARLAIFPAHDDYNGIGAGFGFPVRYRVEVSDGDGMRVVLDRSGEDQAGPGTDPVETDLAGSTVRTVRLTATRLAPRSNDYILALAEMKVWDREGNNVAREGTVRALDSIESGVRWGRSNLIDGIHPGSGDAGQLLARARMRHEAVLKETVPRELRERREALARELEKARDRWNRLPAPMKLYVGRIHTGRGAFRGTGADGGRPREIRVLERGDVTRPGRRVGPGAVSVYEGGEAHFDLPEGHHESLRRIALANWIADPRNPLTWRSIVNRVWQHHFGEGIVATANDFGRMGERPSHPDLLDWLAADFRDGGQSLKRLHRLILCSATWRQGSAWREEGERIDSGNRLLWRMNRRRLDAESLRDSVLHLAGVLDTRMYGPSFRDFVIEKPEHSPHYRYHLHDPLDPRSHRRSIYRFLVRSQPQPLMTVMDCADPSMLVARRAETLTPLQALSLLNNPFMTAMAGRMAARSLPAGEMFLRATGREAETDEREWMEAYGHRHGGTALCRVLFNLNEFLYID